MTTDNEIPTQVVALCVDLMDRSKLKAAFPDITVVRSIAALGDAIDEHRAATTANMANVALIDLSRIDDPADLRPITEAGVRVIAYGSHVDEAHLAAAADAGTEALPRSLFFRRLGDGSLI